MKVDTNLLLMAETNYAEPLDINVVEIAERKVESKVEVEEDEDFILIENEREATDGLPKVLTAKILSDKKLTEATEGLRMKFEEVKISDDQMLGVNMVDFEQPNTEMVEVERCLERGREQRRENLPRKDAGLREYLFHYHKKNQEK